MKTISSEDFIKATEDMYPDLHRKSAMGDVFAIYKLARLYDCGIFREEESRRAIVGCGHYQKAFELYKKGTDQDDPDCSYGLAIMYHTGRWSPDYIPNVSGERSDKNDLYMGCLQRAADLGHSRAAERLGVEKHV